MAFFLRVPKQFEDCGDDNNIIGISFQKQNAFQTIFCSAGILRYSKALDIKVSSEEAARSGRQAAFGRGTRSAGLLADSGGHHRQLGKTVQTDCGDFFSSLQQRRFEGLHTLRG